MLPIFTIIGRPNVGKSTLFNTLTHSRNALVGDQAGVTRDRQYGEGIIDERSFIVVDTGGIAENVDPHLAPFTQRQVEEAIQEANIILFVVDVKAGLTSADREIAEKIRSHQDKVVVVVNKIDGLDPEIACSEFYQLGFKKIFAISAPSHRSVMQTMSELIKPFPLAPVEDKQSGIIITFVGRPNVGKSTLVNRLLGEERVIVFDEPGTTRDSIFIPFERRGVRYTLVDTAGVRRRARVTDPIEKFSILKTLQAVAKSHVAILLGDAQSGITDQDLRLLGQIIEMGKPLVIAINKWDGLSDYQRKQVKEDMEERLRFAAFARRYFISAEHGTGVGKLFPAIHEAYDAAHQQFSTSQLTKTLEQAVEAHQPPAVSGRRIRLRFAHLVDQNPLVIVIHGKQTQALPPSYTTYLINFFRKRFNLIGVPIHIRFKNDPNPYVD